MIYGIGLDVLQVSRVVKLIDKYGDKFLNRTFTVNEICKANKFASKTRRVGYYAKRFAAKESLAKALGIGIGKNISFLDIEISNDQLNMPYFILSAKAKEFISEKFDGCKYNIFLTLSDEVEIAAAMVVIEKINKEDI